MKKSRGGWSKKTFLTAVCTLCLNTIATADVPEVTMTKDQALESNWTGVYIGGNGGWGQSKLTTSETPFGVEATHDVLPQAEKHDLNGSIFGGQIGYNKQVKNVVIGIEGDIDGTGINGIGQTIFPSQYANLSGQVRPNTSSNAFLVQNNIDWLASIRGRLGITLRSGLLYFTGGGAWGKNSTHVLSTGNVNNLWGVATPINFSMTSGGYVVGAGYESMITNHWSIRGEYLFYGFNGKNNNPLLFAACSGSGCGENISTNQMNINTLRLGVNYKI